MDKNKAINTIIYQCDAEDGFLIQLRSWRRFQQDKYGELINAIKAYRDAIANEATIERKVAGSLQIRTKVRTSFGNDFRGYDRDLPP